MSFIGRLILGQRWQQKSSLATSVATLARSPVDNLQSSEFH
jgi:hypothetical protein